MDYQFQVNGMTCGHCEMAVKKAIQKVDPQAQVAINRSAGEVKIQSNQPKDQLTKAITDEGYQVIT